MRRRAYALSLPSCAHDVLRVCMREGENRSVCEDRATADFILAMAPTMVCASPRHLRQAVS